ncbi:MAG: hypothetical protein LUF33_08440 [Clostridiales bacterium]|nr:hypothetical protein [Clostridiales bacterium]
MDELYEYFSEEDKGFFKKQLSRDVIKYGFYEDKNDKKIKLKNDNKD